MKLYPILRSLFQAGYEVNLRPKKKGLVTLTVQKAANGCHPAMQVDLINMEWELVEDGIADRLKEAAENLGVKLNP